MMRFSCATICTEGFGDTNFENTFRLLPQAGYRFVEFNLWHPSMMMPRTIESLSQRCASGGLTASSVHASSLGTPEEPHICKEIAHKLWMLEICKKLGCRMLCATGQRRGSAGGLGQIIAVLKELVGFL